MQTKTKKISAEEFDKKFDDGEDITEFLDLSSATKKVLVDFNQEMVSELDKEAKRANVPRQALIKVWLRERLDEEFERRRRA